MWPGKLQYIIDMNLSIFISCACKLYTQKNWERKKARSVVLIRRSHEKKPYWFRDENDIYVHIFRRILYRVLDCGRKGWKIKRETERYKWEQSPSRMVRSRSEYARHDTILARFEIDFCFSSKCTNFNFTLHLNVLTYKQAHANKHTF